MKTVTLKINKRNLNAIIRKTNFKVSGGMFNPYQFIAINFDTEKDNTATFYESTIVSSNSWTNYPGTKIWNNGQSDWTKAEVFARIEDTIEEILNDEIAFQYPNIKLEFINF